MKEILMVIATILTGTTERDFKKSPETTLPEQKREKEKAGKTRFSLSLF